MRFREKERIVRFVNEDILKAFKKLKKNNPNLFKFIDRALDDLKEKPVLWCNNSKETSSKRVCKKIRYHKLVEV